MVMAIENPVIIMALYDIGRNNWNSFQMSYQRYLDWMKNTLSLDANIVVFTETKFVEKIKSTRKEFDKNLEKTIIIERPLEELECYKKYHSQLCDLMFSDLFKKKIQTLVPEMNRPLYNVIMFNKFFFLKEVKDNKYFNCDFLIWADAGGLRENVDNYKLQLWPCLQKINQLDNSKITFFSHNDNINVVNKEYHALSQIRNIQGTCFFVPCDLIDNFVDELCFTIEESIKENYIGSDEKILDIAYTKNPNRYNLIKCGWREYFHIFQSDLYKKKGDRLEKERMWYAGQPLPKEGQGFGGILENGFYVNYLHGLNFLCKQYVKKNTRILELGCFNGVSSELFSEYSDSVACVDIEFYPEMQKVVKNRKNIRFFKQDSIEFLNNIKYDEYDLIYIDTVHSYDHVKKEISIAYQKLKEGSYICGHDYNSHGVYSAVLDFFKYPEIQIFLDSSWAIQK